MTARSDDSGHAEASATEAAVVLGIPTIAFLAGTLWVEQWLGGSKSHLTDATIGRTLAIELGLTIALLPYLLRRGWSPARAAGGAPEPRDILRGAGVWLLCLAALWTSFLVISVASPPLASRVAQPAFTGSLSPAAIIGVSLLNPVFEEFLWLGYGLPALTPRYGLRGAALISIALRVSVHAYQGILALVVILPVAIALTWYYQRSGRLWPVIVAHVIMDTIGLATFMAKA